MRIGNMQIFIQSIDVVFVISSLKWIWDFEYKKPLQRQAVSTNRIRGTSMSYSIKHKMWKIEFLLFFTLLVFRKIKKESF